MLPSRFLYSVVGHRARVLSMQFDASQISIDLKSHLFSPQDRDSAMRPATLSSPAIAVALYSAGLPMLRLLWLVLGFCMAFACVQSCERKFDTDSALQKHQATCRIYNKEGTGSLKRLAERIAEKKARKRARMQESQQEPSVDPLLSVSVLSSTLPLL